MMTLPRTPSKKVPLSNSWREIQHIISCKQHSSSATQETPSSASLPSFEIIPFLSPFSSQHKQENDNYSSEHRGGAGGRPGIQKNPEKAKCKGCTQRRKCMNIHFPFPFGKGSSSSVSWEFLEAFMCTSSLCLDGEGKASNLP